MKKFLLVLILAPGVLAILAVAAGVDVGSPETSTKQTSTSKSTAPITVRVPVTISGPDKTYTTKKSATVTNDGDGDEARGALTIEAKPVDSCAPNENTESETKWCRGGSQMHSWDVNIHLKSGKAVECSEYNEWFWTEDEYEDIEIYCDEPLALKSVESIEVLGTRPY